MLTFLAMLQTGTRLVGYVEVKVGTTVVTVPVQEADYDRDSDTIAPGGLFQDEAGAFGILVDSAAPPDVVKERIAEAAEEAARILARKHLN